MTVREAFAGAGMLLSGSLRFSDGYWWSVTEGKYPWRLDSGGNWCGSGFIIHSGGLNIPLDDLPADNALSVLPKKVKEFVLASTCEKV